MPSSLLGKIDVSHSLDPMHAVTFTEPNPGPVGAISRISSESRVGNATNTQAPFSPVAVSNNVPVNVKAIGFNPRVLVSVSPVALRALRDPVSQRVEQPGNPNRMPPSRPRLGS